MRKESENTRRFQTHYACAHARARDEVQQEKVGSRGTRGVRGGGDESSWPLLGSEVTCTNVWPGSIINDPHRRQVSHTRPPLCSPASPGSGDQWSAPAGKRATANQQREKIAPIANIHTFTFTHTHKAKGRSCLNRCACVCVWVSDPSSFSGHNVRHTSRPNVTPHLWPMTLSRSSC